MAKSISYEEFKKLRTGSVQSDDAKDFHQYNRITHKEGKNPLLTSPYDGVLLKSPTQGIKNKTAENAKKVEDTLPLYVFKDTSGNEVGEISKNGIDALYSFNLENYKPVYPAEKATIEKFEAQKGTPMFDIQLGENNYKVSYNAAKSINEGNFEYVADNDSDKNAVFAARKLPVLDVEINGKPFKVSYDAWKSIESGNTSYTPPNESDRAAFAEASKTAFDLYNEDIVANNPRDDSKRATLVKNITDAETELLSAKGNNSNMTAGAAFRSGNTQQGKNIIDAENKVSNAKAALNYYDQSVTDHEWRKGVIDEYNALSDEDKKVVSEYTMALKDKKAYYVNVHGKLTSEDYIRDHFKTDNPTEHQLIKALKEYDEKSGGNYKTLPEHDILTYESIKYMLGDMKEKALKEKYKAIANKKLNENFENYVNQYINAEKAQVNYEFTKRLADRAPVSTVISGTPVSILTNLVSPVGLVEVIDAKIDNRPIDPNSPWYAPSNVTEDIRGISKEKINKGLGGGIWGKIGEGAYDLTVNLGDFFAANAVGGQVGKVIGGIAGASAATTSKIASATTQVLMSTRAGSDTVKQAKRDGASDSQALWLGIAAAGAEAFFEKFSIERFNAFKSTLVGRKTLRTFWQSAVKGFLPEATEELNTEIANTVFDNLIMGENSALNRRVRELTAAQELSEDKAWQTALIELAGQGAYAFILGGFSGSIMAATGHIMAPTTKQLAQYLNSYAKQVELAFPDAKLKLLNPATATAQDIEAFENALRPYEKKVEEHNKKVRQALISDADSKIDELTDILGQYRSNAPSELETYRESGKTEEEVTAFEAAQKDRANDYKTLIGKYRSLKDDNVLAANFIAKNPVTEESATHIDITDNSPVLILKDGDSYQVIDDNGYIFTKTEQQITQRYKAVEAKTETVAEMAEINEIPKTAETTSDTVTEEATSTDNTPATVSETIAPKGDTYLTPVEVQSDTDDELTEISSDTQMPETEINTSDNISEAESDIIKETAHTDNADSVNESSDYSSPEYETPETRKPIVPTDFQADKKRRAEAAKQYGLNPDEAKRLEAYVKGSLCYLLNERMIKGTPTDGESKIIESIHNALLKMPEYSGRTYRNLQFDTEQEYNNFLSEYSEGNMVEFKAFTSASKLPNGYTKFGNGVVHLVIDGVSGRDIADTFGLPRQQEVIYLPGTVIEIKKVMVANDGNTLIFAQEVKSDEQIRANQAGSTGDNRPASSLHQDLDEHRTGSGRNGANRSSVRGKVQSGHRRDGILSEWGKSADIGNVQSSLEEINEVNSDEQIRANQAGSTGNNRPASSTHQDLDEHRTGSGRNGTNSYSVSGKVQSGHRRDGILSERGKSADAGSVLGEYEGISSGGGISNAKEINKNGRLETSSKEQSNVLQQVQTEGELHGDLHKISERDTARSVDTENSVQGVRSDKEGLGDSTESDIIEENDKTINEAKENAVENAKAVTIDKLRGRSKEQNIINKSEEIQSGISGVDDKTALRLDDGRGHGGAKTRTGKSETRSLTDLISDNQFKNFAYRIADELSAEKLRELFEQYSSDERINTEGMEHMFLAAYDILSNPDHQLREVFTDEVAEYFNTEKDAKTDITGKNVADNVLKATQNSVVKNESGQLIPVYHSTGAEFDTFTPGDIGIHFGSLSQAKQRANDKSINNPRYIRAYLNITNPLVVDSDFFGWNAFQIAQQLEKMGVLSNDEATSYLNNSKNDVKKGNNELRELLKSKGYDGIVYTNSIEATSGRSYAVFDNSQVYETNIQPDKENLGDSTESDIIEPSETQENSLEQKQEVKADGNTEGRITLGDTRLQGNKENGVYSRGSDRAVEGHKDNAGGGKGRTDGSDKEALGIRERANSGELQRGIVRNVFHGTPYSFTNHEKSYVDLGIHFGTEKQAKSRLDNAQGNLIQRDLKLENPLVTQDIFGERTPEQYVAELVKKSELSDSEKEVLKKAFDDFLKSNIKREAKRSLESKLSSGKYKIKKDVSKDGVFVSLVLVDDSNNINEIPLTELIDKNALVDILGFDSTVEILKNNKMSQSDANKLDEAVREAILPFEMQYLKLREIENILKSFGYDGFAYHNENEGDGWSYAVFDNSQIFEATESNEDKVDNLAVSGFETTEKVTPPNTSYTITPSTHTKTGEAIWVISLNDRLDAEDFKKLKANLKSLGGYYSTYVKGFVFKSEPTKEITGVLDGYFTANQQNEKEYSDAEITALMSYKSSESYKLNVKMRYGFDMSEQELWLIEHINSALDKSTVYQGTVYRNIGFDTQEEFDNFISQHNNKSEITYSAFTSSSKTVDGYTVDESYSVHYEIISHSGRDIEAIGITSENEVLFKSGTVFSITEFAVTSNHIEIKMEEISEHGQDPKRSVKSESTKSKENASYQRNTQESVLQNRRREIRERRNISHDSLREGSTAYAELPQEQSPSNGQADRGRGLQDSRRGSSRTGSDMDDQTRNVRINNKENIENDSQEQTVLAGESAVDDRGLRSGAGRADDTQGTESADGQSGDSGSDVLPQYSGTVSDGHSDGDDGSGDDGADDGRSAVSEAGAVDTNGELNSENVTSPTQLIKNYDAAVDDIVNISDETAKEYAEKRVAVEISEHTPDVILNNVKDAKDLKVIINYTKLYLAVRKSGIIKGHYHNLGTEISKQLPDFLNKPDAIIQLGNGRLNIFATVQTEKGNNGIISVELNSTKDIDGKYQDYNVVVTMFSSDDNYVQNLISGDGVTVKYKREDLSQVNPQLYTWLAIINDKSSTDNSITQNEPVVNSSIPENDNSDALEDTSLSSENADADTSSGVLYMVDADGFEYTDEQYNDFGWARANGILNAGQNADYRSKFADAKAGRARFNKSKNGEYIIPVSDIYDTTFEGINNVLVFAKGTVTNPVITSVIEIFEYDETILDKIRRTIYGLERRGIQQKAGELFRRYSASDFRMQHETDVFQISRHSDGNGHRGRSGAETVDPKSSNAKRNPGKLKNSFVEAESPAEQKHEQLAALDIKKAIAQRGAKAPQPPASRNGKPAVPETDSLYGSISQKNNLVNTSDGKNNSSNDNYTENCKTLVQMDSVANLSGNELDGEKPLKTKIANLFSSWGNKVSTKTFGDIELTNSSIRSDIRHGTTREKVTAYAAIPQVLQKGVVVDVLKKNFGEVQRIVVAAPINISGVPYIMGAMIQRNSNTQRLYLHDVALKKEVSEYQPDHLNTTGPLDTKNLFITDILEKAMSVGYSILEKSGVVNTSDGKNNSKNDNFIETDNAQSTTRRHSDEDIAVAEQLALMRGYALETFYDEDITAPAWTDKENKVVKINLASFRNPIDLVGHELFHTLDYQSQTALIRYFRLNAKTDTEQFRTYKAQTMQAYQKQYDKEGRGRVFTEADFWREFAAENCRTLFTNRALVNDIVAHKPSLGQRILGAIRKLWFTITGKSIYTSTRATRAAQISADVLAKAEKMYAEALKTPSLNLPQASDKNKITVNMNDGERFEILKDKTVSVTSYDKEKLNAVTNENGELDVENLNDLKLINTKKILRTLGEKLGIFKQYHNKDINIDFEFSKAGFSESVNKQSKRYDIFAQLLTVMDEVTENAIAIEAHNERYNNPKSKIDTSYILVSAFENTNGIVPVRLTVKTYTDNTVNRLYVVISAEAVNIIKKAGVVTERESVFTPNKLAARPAHDRGLDGSGNLFEIASSARPAFNISIADLFANVKPSDINLLKYIPDGFLDDEQLTAKGRGIKQTEAYIEKKNKKYASSTLPVTLSTPAEAIAEDTGYGESDIDGDIDFFVDTEVRDGVNTEMEAAYEEFAKSASGMQTKDIQKNSLLTYDDELSRIIQQHGDYIIKNNEDIKSIVNLAFDYPDKKATAYFGIIPAEVLTNIETKIPNLPKEFSGTLFKPGRAYSIAATLDSIRHLNDGKNLSRNDIVEYLSKMSNTIVDFDTVNFDYYRQGNSKSNGLIFKKSFVDGTIHSFEIISNKKRTLNLHTVYMEKSDYIKKKSAETMPVEIPSAHVQDAGRSDFNNSVPDFHENVNTEFSDVNDINYFIDTQAISEVNPEFETAYREFEKQAREMQTEATKNRSDAKQKENKGALLEGFARIVRTLKYIPESGKAAQFFAEARKTFLVYQNAPKMAQDSTVRAMQGYISMLTKDEFELFRNYVLLKDYEETVTLDPDAMLPGGLTPQGVENALKYVETQLTDNIRKAYDKRQEVFRQTVDNYVAYNKLVGYDTSGKFNRSSYYRHVINEFIGDVKGTGQRSMHINSGRGFLKARNGSELSIDTDLLRVDFDVLKTMKQDTYRAEALYSLQSEYDIKKQLEGIAKNSNKAALDNVYLRESGGRIDAKGRPDSESYRTVKEFDKKIAIGFSNLYGNSNLPLIKSEFARTVSALELGRMPTDANTMAYIAQLAAQPVYVQSKKISVGMSDSERFELLKDKVLSVVHYDKETLNAATKENGEIDIVALKRMKTTDARKILRVLSEKLGVFKQYHNKDIDIDFEFSRGGFSESINKQGKNYDTFAQLITVMDEVAKNAIAIEANTERYNNSDSDIDTVYVFASAFANDEGIIPIRLVVKTFKRNASNKLHIIVSANTIPSKTKKNRGRSEDHINSYENDTLYTRPILNISIADLFSNVKPSDVNLLKYIPDGFLDTTQLAAKQKGIKQTEAYIAKKNEKYAPNTSSDTSDGNTGTLEDAVISARTILKAISQKNAYIKELLGDSFITWEDVFDKEYSDKYRIVQPRIGVNMYKTELFDAQAVNDMMAMMADMMLTGDTSASPELKTELAKTIWLRGAPFKQWVIPVEIANQLEETTKAPGKINKFLSVTFGKPLTIWKRWVTGWNPLSRLKYNLRNLIGDADALFAGAPAAFKKVPQAIKELASAMYDGKELSPGLIEWKKRGGDFQLLLANEIDEKTAKKLFSSIKLDEENQTIEFAKEIGKELLSGDRLNSFRESILRYAAFLYFDEHIKKHGVTDYAASNRHIINGLKDDTDKAYQLANDLMGAYDQVSQGGQFLRRTLIPFWSFTETNFRRYTNLIYNSLVTDEATYGNTEKRFGRVGAMILKKAGTGALMRFMQMNALGFLMLLWNNVFRKDEEEALPEYVQKRPHITLFRVGNNILTFDRLGSWAEFLEWFGMDSLIEGFMDGESVFDAAAGIPQNLIDKSVNMTNPYITLLVEFFTGQSFYPSITSPQYIRDRAEYVVNDLFGAIAGNAYNYVAKRPHKTFWQMVASSVVYYKDFRESAYNDVLYEYIPKWQNKGDTSKSSHKPNAMQNAMYYMKKGIRYKQKDVALAQMEKYFELGGTPTKFLNSMFDLSPLKSLEKRRGEKPLPNSTVYAMAREYGVKKDEVTERFVEFVETLNDNEKEKFKTALLYYNEDLRIPEKLEEQLDKLEDNEIKKAKAILTKYINNMCS